MSCLTVFLVVAFLIGVVRMAKKSSARADWVASTNDVARVDNAQMLAALSPNAAPEQVIHADDRAHERGVSHDALHAKGIELRLQAAAIALRRREAALSELYAIRRSLAGAGTLTATQAHRVDSLRDTVDRRISLAADRGVPKR